MTGNFDEIPDDATGGALRWLLEEGADLSKPHHIDFAIAVPSETAARVVMQYAQAHGYEADLEKDEDGPDWTCTCSKMMVPSHDAISKVEAELDAVAQPVGGWADGWGTFAVK